MAIYYVDPSAAASGNGSLASPFRSWTSVTWAPGNTYLQKRGTTYSGVFRIAASGTAGQRIAVGAYARADGADDPSRPKPIIQLPAAPVTPAAGASVAVRTQERDYITYRNLDIRNPALPQASDVAILWIGNDCVLENLAIRSNCAGLYIFDKQRVRIVNCVVDAVACDPVFANHGILVAASGALDSIALIGNTLTHRGGGTASSHGIRCETYSAAARLTALLIQGNRIAPVPGLAGNPNRGAIGIYLVNGLNARVERNSITGMLAGIFINSGENNQLIGNVCERNKNFGIHITGVARNFLIEGNTCNGNGADGAPNYYGRGIELSSAAGPGAVSGHMLRRNTCRYNRNFGGPLDNGSEGVGIGLDDGASRCTLVGNHLADNEGNGVQLYGGAAPERYPDTGGHSITGNVLDRNCAYSVLRRRQGGTTASPFQAHVQLSWIYGSRTLIANNLFLGPTRATVVQDANCANVVVLGNIMAGAAAPEDAGAESGAETAS